MKPTPHQLSVSQLSLYNPARLADEEIIASFAVRQTVFERILADVTGEKRRSRAQHHLVVGQRGMGKSMLLARLAAELRQQPKLSATFLPLVFAEEQYAVDRLSKFWLNCLDSLADACERAGNAVAAKRIDYAVRQLAPRQGASAARDEEPAAEALQTFLDETVALERRPVLLVDNLQLVFERLADQQQHVLRELLMRPGGPLLIGASPSPPPESRDYGAAFYDHFKVHYLAALSVEQMRQLMLTLAERVGRADVRERILREPHRLDVLRQLTGGNPRTTVTLFFLYAEDFAPSVFGDLENLLDRVTPLYKARFEELSPQQQVVAGAIANHWDPVTARALAEATGLAVTGVSPQLDRLEKTGFIERVSLFGEAAIGFQIAERFFNVWFLMRNASRRQRREVEFLTRFIESFYEAQDRSRLARHLQSEHDYSPDRHLFARALAGTLEKGEARDLQRHAELDALRQKETDARRKLEEVIDFSQLAPATLAFAELREKLASLVPANALLKPEEFAETVLGDRKRFQTVDRGRLASRNRLSLEEIEKALSGISATRDLDEQKYGGEAIEWLARRLSSGQLAGVEELDDWNAAFRLAPDAACTQLLVDSVPSSLGAKLAADVVAKIRGNLQPQPQALAPKWFGWGYVLHSVLHRYEEAEVAYRNAIDRDGKWAWPWHNLGFLLQYNLGRADEAENAYRQAIERDGNAARTWNNLGNLLHYHLGRFEEAEIAYRQALTLDKADGISWNNLGNLLAAYLGRYDEAEAAYRQSIAHNARDASPWNGLGNLLQDHFGRYAEAETAYRQAQVLNMSYAAPWNGLGNLFFDHYCRYEEAARFFARAMEIDPTEESPVENLVFLYRDFLGDNVTARTLFQKLLVHPKIRFADTIELHHALFAAYAENWGLAREALERALAHTANGFPAGTSTDWLRASTVLLHLNYGESLLACLRERGDETRLRPWYEALAALDAGERRMLQNLAPEIRVTAEAYFDQIEKRLKALPAKTCRRPANARPKPAGKRSRK